MNKITCPNCGNALNTTTINRRTSVVSCAYCGGVFDPAARERENADALNSTPIFEDQPPPSRPVFIKPTSVQIKQDGSKHIISWQWLNKHSILKFAHALFYLLGPTLPMLLFAGFVDRRAYLLAPFAFIYQIVSLRGHRKPREQNDHGDR